MKTIELNGERYVLETEHQKALALIKTETPISESKLSPYGIFDCTNTTMFLQISDDWEKNDTITIPSPKSVFKKTDTLDKCKKSYDGERIWTHKNHLISNDFVEMFKKVLLIFNYVDSERKSRKSKEWEMTLYEGYDEEKKEWKKTFPVLIKYGRFGMIVAPRIDADDN